MVTYEPVPRWYTVNSNWIRCSISNCLFSVSVLLRLTPFREREIDPFQNSAESVELAKSLQEGKSEVYRQNLDSTVRNFLFLRRARWDSVRSSRRRPLVLSTTCQLRPDCSTGRYTVIVSYLSEKLYLFAGGVVHVEGVADNKEYMAVLEAAKPYASESRTANGRLRIQFASTLVSDNTNLSDQFSTFQVFF